MKCKLLLHGSLRRTLYVILGISSVIVSAGVLTGCSFLQLHMDCEEAHRKEIAELKAKYGDKVSAVFATTTIEKGTLITSDQVAERQIDTNQSPFGVLTSKVMVIGHRADTDISRGKILTGGAFLFEDDYKRQIATLKAKYGSNVKVVTAVKDIDEGTVITADMLDERTMKPDKCPLGVVTSKKTIIGCKADFPIPHGVVLVKFAVASADEP